MSEPSLVKDVLQGTSGVVNTYQKTKEFLFMIVSGIVTLFLFYTGISMLKNAYTSSPEDSPYGAYEQNKSSQKESGFVLLLFGLMTGVFTYFSYMKYSSMPG
jgi:hypothetical protein